MLLFAVKTLRLLFFRVSVVLSQKGVVSTIFSLISLKLYFDRILPTATFPIRVKVTALSLLRLLIFYFCHKIWILRRCGIHNNRANGGR